MKILTAAQIREADAYTIKNEPISSIKLMDRAADELVNWLIVHIKIFTRFEYTFFCGVGNNGGDALVMARIFKERKFRAKVYIVESSKNYSPEFEFNLKRLEEVNITPIFLTEENTNFELHENTVIIDAIFGTGLSKPVTGFVAEIIKKINTKEQEIISIDIPSGLYADSNIQNKSEAIIRATRTLSLQQPKLAFFYPENHQFVGDFNIIDIRLHPAFLKEVSTNYFYTTYSEIRYLVKRRSKFAHKGTFGHALLICGSKGKMGAAVLAAKSCMKTGTGLTTALIPEIGLNVLQIAVPEVMCIATTTKDYINELPTLSSFSAVGIGPGIGTEKQTQNVLKLLIQNSKSPLVIDADALNILSENKTWLAFLPPNSILTPHPKEFERLVGKWNNDEERLTLQKELAQKHQLYVVLKGANTAIACPDGKVFFNSTGNPGMATAGSGDVLTGIITGLLAQGYEPKIAAILGVYLHGFAGDEALKKVGEVALNATDIIEHIHCFFQQIDKQYKDYF